MINLDDIIGDIIFISFINVDRIKDIGITKQSGHFLLIGTGLLLVVHLFFFVFILFYLFLLLNSVIFFLLAIWLAF